MKALVIKKYGGPEVLEVREVATPVPANDEVLVNVKFAGINPVDFKIRKGMVFFLTGFKFPKILGGDIAGVVEDVPVGSLFKPGDRVFAMLNIRGGGYGEYACVKPAWLCKIPENLTFGEAAAVPLAGLTALQSLRDLGKIGKASKVLINGASGGVGHLAVQIARWYGAEVTAVCSGKNADWVKSLGAQHVIDYENTDVLSIRDSFDIVFDAVAKLPVTKAGCLLNKKGVYISTIPHPKVYLFQLFSILSGKKYKTIMASPSGKDLELLSAMVKENGLKPHIEKVFHIAEGPMAHRTIESERVRGKLVFDLTV